MPTRLEINVATGEEQVIELTPEEIAQLEASAAQALKHEEERKHFEQKRLEARESAAAKLAALGLTPEEIAAL